MKHVKRRALVAALLAVAVSVAVPAAVSAGPDTSATVRFGNLKAGSPFPPPTGHDRSFNAEDNVIPRNVVLSGGASSSVSFEVDGFHQPVVYAQGIGPSDITVPAFNPVTEVGLFVNDFDGDLFFGVPVASPQVWAPETLAPGKYLMICNVTPHFAFAKMYGWITVK